jgi:predicted phage-related endonuclease
MIESGRFVASKNVSAERWLSARREGVTATQVAKAAAGPGGFEQAVEDYRADFVEQDNPYMAFGRAWEGPISMHLKDRFGVMPNDWLISSSVSDHYLATPDGLTLRHEAISEVKTTGKDWNPERIPIQYRRQVQWQLFVTGAEKCFFAWMLREERDGAFLPGWFEPKVVEMRRDEEMIRSLVTVADELWERVCDRYGQV